MRAPRALLLALVLAESIALLYLSLIPSFIAPGVPSPSVRTGYLIHFLAYAVYALSWNSLLARSSRSDQRSTSTALRALLIAAAVGLLLELLQSTVPNRSADLLDFAADILGAAAALRTAGAALRIGAFLGTVTRVPSRARPAPSRRTP